MQLGLGDCSVDAAWIEALRAEFDKEYFRSLARFVKAERASKAVYPPVSQVFRAFAETGLQEVRVVILGQDPYHGPHQAHGLAFSVPSDVALPPSLKNIFKEISSDLLCPVRKQGDLSDWARQGVFLLNTTLTVTQGQPNSHAGKGWDLFTNAVIKVLAKERTGLVFLLWGAHAQSKAEFIDGKKHLVIKTSHPSPLGAAKTSSPFLGSKQFSRANAYLKSQGKEEVKW